MKQGVKFAKEIVMLEKEMLVIHKQCSNLPSKVYDERMGDRRTTLTENLEELMYYCKEKGLDFNTIMDKAREELDEEEDIQKKIDEAGK